MIDFEQLADNLNIPVLRKEKHTSWLGILMSPLVRVQIWWNERLNGASYPVFSGATDYTIYDTVQYGRASFWCIQTPPTGLYPLPTNTTYWYKVLDDYIGIAERSKYSAQKVMLEYALNRRFSPSTITPPFGPSIPSIYIQNNNILAPKIIYSGPGTTNTKTWSAPNSSMQFWYSPLGNPDFTTVYNFTVFVPTAIMSGIGPTLPESIYIIMQEVNKYNRAGYLYDVQQY